MIAKRLLIFISFLLILAATLFYLLRVWPDQQSEELVIETPPKEIPLEKRASPSSPNTSAHNADPSGTPASDESSENFSDEDDVELPPHISTSDENTPHNIPPPPQE